MATKEPKRDVAFVRKLDNMYVQCRSLRHAWNLTYFGGIHSAPEDIRTTFSRGNIVRQSVCLRCGCIKEDFYNTKPDPKLTTGSHEKFRAFYSRYRHPQDYLWHSDNGVERPKLYDFTEELYSRFQSNQLEGNE